MTISPSKLFSTGLLSLAFLFSNSVFAAFEAVIDSPEQAVVNSQVTFKGDRSHGTQLSYEWNFNDGSGIVTGPTTTKSYPNVGEYSVTLTVKKQTSETISTTKIITILAADPVVPETSFTIDTTPSDTATGNFKVGQQIKLTSTSTGNGSINNNWDFGEKGNQAAERANSNVQDLALYGTGSDVANPKLLTTVTRPFLAPGTFTITLASQTNFTSDATAATAGALTGTYQKTITVDPCVQGTDPNCSNGGQNKKIELIYEENCARCHGLVKRTYSQADVNKQNPIFETTMYQGEHSFLAARGGPNATTPRAIPVPAGAPVDVTDALILAAYDIVTTPNAGAGEKLMSGVYILTAQEAIDMANYLSGLTLNTDQNGSQLYRYQCSRCHGTGTGGYGVNVMPTTVASIKVGIKTVAEMSSIPASDADLLKIENFLNKVPAVNDPLDPLGLIAPLKKPTTGDGLYVMYCSYCHGQDGIGGPFVHESIANSGYTASSIMAEILKGSTDPKNSNKMGKLQRLIDKGYLLESDFVLIEQTLASLNGTPKADEDDED